MVPLRDLPAAIQTTLTDWRAHWDNLRFEELSIAVLVVVILLAAAGLVLLTRALRSPRHGATRLTLPAILPVIRRSPLSKVRHAPFVMFALGVPLFAVALADPRVTLVQEEVSRSGRRIAILIDGSGSMVLPFESPTLKPVMERSFYTAVAAAERFVRLRMAGGHTDVMSLIQFGNEAYVVTPFTTDYENVLLSTRLIGEPRAWNRFNVFGTTIIQGIDQGLELFKTFGMFNATGNLIVLFTDGNDGETMFRGRTLEQMMTDARAHQIPIYMVRMGFGKRLGDVAWDGLWKAAVEHSGGRFYAAADENSILRAIGDIDRVATGRIGVRRYSSAIPGFAGYTLGAVVLWLGAAVLKLGVPFFRTFP